MTEANTAAPAAHRFLRLPAVLERVGVSKSTLQRWIKAGMFPAGIALTPTRSTVAWSAAAVEAWIADKLATAGGICGGAFSIDAAQAA